MASLQRPIMLIFCLMCIFVWSSNGDSPGQATDESPHEFWQRTNWYHFVYQVQMYERNESTTMEEWANYDEQKYRVDSVQNGVRTSHLHLGKTKERILYSPFVCEQVSASPVEFMHLSKLFFGHRVSDNDTEDVYGLGHLWKEMKLRQKLGLATVNHIPNGGDSHEFSTQFERYEFDVRDEKWTGLVRFYFPKGQPQFDSVDWVTKSANGGEIMLARLKLVKLDYIKPDEYTFKLPLGYGCKRAGTLKDIGSSGIGLSLLNQDYPQQVLFNVIFSEPKNDLLHSWSSERYSVRVMHNSVQRRDVKELKESYYGALIRSRGSEDGKVKRTRQVSWAPDNSVSAQAIVYQIDQSTGQCQVSHREVRDQIIVGQGDSSSTPNEKGKRKPIRLSVDAILNLFRDDNDYALVDEGETFSEQRFRNRYYEKRLNNFTLSSEGNITWKGPVSVVKRISSYSLNYGPENTAHAGAQKAKLALSSEDQAAATIFFFSDGFKKLLHKVVIEMTANRRVSYAYAHEQLDVSACFDDNSRLSEEISLKYPIRNTKLVKKLEEKEEAIKSALARNLFGMEVSPIEYIYNDEHIGLGSVLSPLQVSGVQVSFDTFNVHIKMTVLDVPLSHLFKMEAHHKLAPSAEKHSLMEMSASTADKCADHCDFYNCPMFSFDPTTKACQLELAGGHGVKAIHWPHGQMYTYYDQLRRSLAVRESTTHDAATFESAGERMHMDAGSIVRFFSRAIAVTSGTGHDWLLVLKINLRPNLKYLNDDKKNDDNIVTLIPESISHELDTFKEYVRELNEEQADKDRVGGVVRVLNGSGGGGVRRRHRPGKIKLQYIKFLENKKFVDSQGAGRFDGLATYDQCEQFCEINDCHSFQYCNSDESCIVTRQSDATTEDELSGAVKEAPIEQECNIYLLDNLSKFENFGIVPTPKQETDLTYTGRDLHTCANTCMNLHYNSCQGFYHCSARAKQDGKPEDVCQITKSHVNSFTDDQFGTHMRRAPSTVRECTFYSRSYLAQFDKYRGKSLYISDSATSGSSDALISFGDTEDCASKCIEQDCLAFDSCPAHSPEDSSKHWSGWSKCRLLLNGIQESQLEHSPRCTTFVLSDKSQFNKRGTKLILDSSSNPASGHLEPDQEAAISPPDDRTSPGSDLETGDIAGPDLELLKMAAEKNRKWSAAEKLREASDSFHWLARLFSFSLGTICGCLLVVGWNEAYARGWFDRVRRGITTRANWN